MHVDVFKPVIKFAHVVNIVHTFVAVLCMQGYFRRAEASKHALKTRCFIPGISYENAIEDYRKSYKLKPDVKTTLAEAILLANDIGGW